jgi:hypothetical protein
MWVRHLLPCIRGILVKCLDGDNHRSHAITTFSAWPVTARFHPRAQPTQTLVWTAPFLGRVSLPLAELLRSFGTVSREQRAYGGRRSGSDTSTRTWQLRLQVQLQL